MLPGRLREFFQHTGNLLRVLSQRELCRQVPFLLAHTRTTNSFNKTNEVVEYETPANTDGLGTQSRLKKSSDPIRGVEILVGKMPDLAVTSLAVRLSPDQADLISVIIQQFEGDARPTASRDK